jgi:predicted O-methyltransferase YrrM
MQLQEALDTLRRQGKIIPDNISLHGMEEEVEEDRRPYYEGNDD